MDGNVLFNNTPNTFFNGYMALTFAGFYLTRHSMYLSQEKIPAHGAVDNWIDSSWWTHLVIFCSCRYSKAGVTKVMLCTILSVGWCILKIPCC